MTARMLNRRIAALGGLSCIFAAGLVMADTINPADAAERIDKLGATGILAFGFLLTIAALIYLIKLQYGKMMEVLDRNSEAITKMVDHCKGKG